VIDASASRELRASLVLAIAIAGAALAIGTVHAVTLCIVAGVLAVSTVLAWWNAEPMRLRPAATIVLFTAVGLTAYTALQCVPIPAAWLAAIAPQNADVWSRALSPLDESGPRWAPISLDPAESRLEALKGIAYVCALLTAVRVARRREGITVLSAAVVVTGVVLGVLAVLHPALGVHKVYGLYQPGFEIQYRHIAPLLNPNHLAGYLNLAFCLSLAATLASEPPVPRPIAGAVALILVAFQVWVASRGGVLAMVVGAAAVAVLVWASRTESSNPRKWATLLCGAAVFVGVGAVVLGSFEEASRELSDPTLSKFKILLDVPGMLAAYGVWGAGRGAFESTFPRFHHGEWNLTVTNPENLLAQWSTEWGVPVTAAALVCLTFALRPRQAFARSRRGIGAWAALVAIAVQNMADYSTEVPGVMIAVTVCAAIVVAGSAGRPARRIERWPLASRTVAVVAVVTSAMGIVGGITALGHQLGDDQERLHAEVFATPPSFDRIADVAQQTMMRHPSEPYLPYVTAVAAARARRADTVRWLNAAMERARSYGPAHYVLARLLASRSPAQARLEYRLAYEQAGDLLPYVEQEVPRLVTGYDDAMELVSSGPRGVAMLESLVVSLASRLPATSARLDTVIARSGSDSLTSARRAAEFAVEDVESANQAPWCTGARRPECVAQALSRTRRLQRLESLQCEGYAFEARALVADGQPGQAMDELQRAADSVVDRGECLKTLARTASSAHDESRFERTLEQIASCAERDCVKDMVWVASTEEQRGDLRRALAVYKRATEISPDDDGLLENVARLDISAGLNADALVAFETLARRHPTEQRWKNAVEAQRRVILKL